MAKIYDVAIIGGGVIGASIFNNLVLSGYSAVLLEKGGDVASGTSKANSGIVHAGFDAKPGTLKAKFNVDGKELNFRATIVEK
jgi:glycerol-3-phosphate dehydrogenase